jgi:hypothetical protein
MKNKRTPFDEVLDEIENERLPRAGSPPAGGPAQGRAGFLFGADAPAGPEPTASQEVLALTLHYGRTLFRAREMKQFFGQSKDLFHECRDAGWLTPVVAGNRLVGYDVNAIVQCLRRLRAEGRPSRRALPTASPES